MQRRPEELRVCCKEPLAREEEIKEAKRRRKNRSFVFITIDVGDDVGFRHQAQVVSSFCCDLSGPSRDVKNRNFHIQVMLLPFLSFGL